MTRMAMIAAVTPARQCDQGCEEPELDAAGRVRGLVHLIHPVAWSTTRTENGWLPLGVIV